MAVQITPPESKHFFTPYTNGRVPLATKVEIAGLVDKNNPKYLGKIVDEELNDASIFAVLMTQGKELVVGAEQFTWKEGVDITTAASVTGAGAVSRAGNEFTINAAAIPADPYDVDQDRPVEPQWIGVVEGLQFAIFDTTGKKDNATITAVSDDFKKLTATPTGGSWHVGESNLDILFTSKNLDHCEDSPCIGYRRYSPARETSFLKDDECKVYCEETEIANGVDGGDAYVLFNAPDGTYTIDEDLEEKQQLLLARNENAYAFERRKTKAEANGRPQGADGILTMAEKMAIKVEGTIDTMADVFNLVTLLRQNKTKKVTMYCTADQFNKLVTLVQPTSPYWIDPFKDNTNALFTIGFKGFDIGGVKIYFKEWSALDNVSANVGKRYSFLIVPEGRLRREVAGKVQEVGYLNIVWFGTKNKVWKFLREEDPVISGKHKVRFINKFAPVGFMVHKWILGGALS